MTAVRSTIDPLAGTAAAARELQDRTARRGVGAVCATCADRGIVYDEIADLAASCPDCQPHGAVLLPSPGPATSTTALRALSGASFVLDAPRGVPAVWGDTGSVLWSEGEPCLIVSPPGVGKTTLAGQLVRGRLGLSRDVLGYPVAQAKRRILYVAADRPRQIARAFRRLFTEQDRTTLADRLAVIHGPPPVDLGHDPRALARWCRNEDADTVVIDSLTNVAAGLTDDLTASKVNQAFQHAVADGIEVLVLHHDRKTSAGAAEEGIDAVYGSRWITAGAGSVIALRGRPGDTTVELVHLKQPAGPVGPLRIRHDHTTGTSTVVTHFDLAEWLTAQPAPVTREDAARALSGTANPTEGTCKKAQRLLEQLVDDGRATKHDARRGGPGGTRPATYEPTRGAA